MDKVINIGMVGTQFMGRAHSNAYLQATRFFDLPLTPVLHTVCGRDTARLDHLANQFEWKKRTSSFEQLIEDEDIDLIDICTPNDMHMPIAVSAAKAGKHVICEKPLARNLQEAKTMYLAARDAGITHMMISNYRFVPAIALAKRLIDKGKIGEIRHFNAVYYQDWLVNPDFPMVWRHDATSSGSGAHGDMNVHTVDLARYLVGEFEVVNGFRKTFIRERPLADGKGKGEVTTDDASLFLSRFRNGQSDLSQFPASQQERKIFCGLKYSASEEHWSLTWNSLMSCNIIPWMMIPKARDIKIY